MGTNTTPGTWRIVVTTGTTSREYPLVVQSTMQNDLPPNLTMLARIVDGHSPDVRELFHYALATLLIEDARQKSSSSARLTRASG